MNSALPVVRTKIITPRRRTEILSRPRLLSILDDILDLKLMIVSAPAGYGKTSLLIDFAYHSKLPICWYSVDSLDSDPKRFIAHFIGAISNVFPAFGEASLSALTNLDQDSMELEPLIAAIINDIFENITEHFVFVLDDYHFVRDSKLIDEFINFLVLGMSENCHLVIASRTLLTLPDLSIMVARSQVGGLSYEELSFAPEEIKQLYAVNYHQTITEQAANDLVVQTVGWITGLLLTARLSNKETASRLRLARVSGIGIYEYLASQVLHQQPDDLVLFLKRSSLLEEFDAQMCSKIFSAVPEISPENWQEKINLLLRENLFVLPVDDETLHLRYHHLFQEYLQTCMRTERPEESRLIELELVKYCEERRDWERAFSIISRVGDETLVAEIIIKAAPSMILGGRLTSLSLWLESITDAEKNASPEILSVRGTVSILKGENSTGLDFLNKAVDGFRLNHNQNELARALIRRSTLFRLIGIYDHAISDAQEAISICSHLQGSLKLEAEAHRSHGVACFQAGELKNALAALSLSQERYTLIAEEMDAAKVLLDLGLVYMTLGKLDDAENVYIKSLDFWRKTHNYLWQAHLLNNLGMVQHHRGDHEKAVISFENAIVCARMATNPRVEGYLFVSLGDLYRDVGAFDEAVRLTNWLTKPCYPSRIRL
jgi:ATP/maltotriose-dependent transcriptional regulator MalT